MLSAVTCGALFSESLSAQTAYTVLPVGASMAARTSGPTIDTNATPQARNDSTRVTLILQDSTLEYVITELARQAHLQPVFDDNDPLLVKRISAHVVKMKVMDALATVLRGTGVSAKLAPDGQTVVIRAISPGTAAARSRADGGTVTGLVHDSASGVPIGGAKISIHGTTVATTTSDRGAFTLPNVPSGEQLIEVRAFGYKPAIQTVNVTEGALRPLRFAMTQNATILSGVVTTATGVQSKLSVGSDITTINVDSVMKTAPISSVTDLLENRVPGLTVVHTTGTPGDPSRLLLRGAASVNGSNNPIVVVDGVRVYDPQNLGSTQNQIEPTALVSGVLAGLPRPSPLDQIDPNTIATIEVLKGPSASALFGSDAANGVIVITTKHGTSGQTHWSVSATQGVSYIPGSFPTLNYAFGRSVGSAKEQQCVAGVTGNPSVQPCIIDSVRSFQALNDPRFSPLTPGPLSNASATISGGAQALTYSFTGSAQNTHGMTKLPSFAADQYTSAVGSPPPAWMRHPDDYLGWSGSGQVQATMSPTASLTVSDMLSSSTQHRTSLGLSAVSDLISVYVDTTNIANTPSYQDFLTQVTQATFTSTTNATLNWRIRPWLPLTVVAGYNRNQDNDKQYLPAGLPERIVPPFTQDTSGVYDLGTNQATSATLNANTTIPLSLGRGPGVNLAAGTTLVSQSSAGQDIHTTQVPVGVSDPTTFPQTTATSISQATQSSATYGWYLEPQLQLNSRLFINPGIRFDGGTASGSGAGFAVFPKTNVSYIAIDHTDQTGGAGWMNALSLLRLRGALGIAGVQPAPGQALRLFGTGNIVSLDGGTVSTTGTVITTLGNTLLHPERSRETEAGFDAQFFQNRASLTATYYNKLRIDAIESVPTAPSIYDPQSSPIGGSTYANVGTIRNTGLEVETSVTLLDQTAVTWNFNASVSTNDNKVISTSSGYGGAACTTGNSYTYYLGKPCVVAGYPLGARFSRTVVGYADLNGDGVIESNEIFLSDSAKYVGSSDPKYVGTFGTTVALWHGRLSIAAQGDYQDGLTISNATLKTLLQSAANVPGADILTQVNGVGSVNASLNNFGLQEVNELRWDAVSINADLPAIIARTLRAQQATLSLQGRNLGIWSNYRGKDPNVNGMVSGIGVVDVGELPEPRVWQLVLRITQ